MLSSRGRNTHWIVPASADNTRAKSRLLSLVVGHHLNELLWLILQPLSYWKCKFPLSCENSAHSGRRLIRWFLKCVEDVCNIGHDRKYQQRCPISLPNNWTLLFNFATLSVATLRTLLWSSSLSQIMQHWTSQHFPRDIPVDLIFLSELSAQESATVSVAPTCFAIFSSIWSRSVAATPAPSFSWSRDTVMPEVTELISLN